MLEEVLERDPSSLDPSFSEEEDDELRDAESLPFSRVRSISSPFFGMGVSFAWC
jgi:hypothetical protein